MIHAFCDFCGKDCQRNATLLTLTHFSNFARYHVDTKPYGIQEKSKSYVICHDCSVKHGLPNPYKDYDQITDQDMSYKEVLPPRQLEYDSIEPTLPFSPGDILYLLYHSATNDLTNQIKTEILEVTVESIHQYSKGHWKVNLHTDKSNPTWRGFEVSLDSYGKTLFSDKKEALIKFGEMKKR